MSLGGGAGKKRKEEGVAVDLGWKEKRRGDTQQRAALVLLPWSRISGPYSTYLRRDARDGFHHCWNGGRKKRAVVKERREKRKK